MTSSNNFISDIVRIRRNQFLQLFNFFIVPFWYVHQLLNQILINLIIYLFDF